MAIKELEELNTARRNWYLIYTYLIIGMFLTAWNLIAGFLFLGIPLLALVSYLMGFIIKDIIKGIGNIFY